MTRDELTKAIGAHIRARRKALKDVPEERDVSTIRDTHIANGVRLGEFK